MINRLVYVADAGSLLKLKNVDKLRWVLVSKRLLRDITIKAYDYEVLDLDNSYPINAKIKSLLNLILAPRSVTSRSAWHIDIFAMYGFRCTGMCNVWF